MSRTFKTAIAALAASVILVPAVHAQAGVEEASVRITYGDLDMSTQAGAETLLKRIKGAARAACKNAIERSPLTPRSETTCRRDTIGATVAQLNITTLTTAWKRTHPASVQLSAR